MMVNVQLLKCYQFDIVPLFCNFLSRDTITFTSLRAGNTDNSISLIIDYYIPTPQCARFYLAKLYSLQIRGKAGTINEP